MGTLSAHIRVHGMKKTEYLTKYPGADMGFDLAKYHEESAKPGGYVKQEKPRENPINKMMGSLSSDELDMYNERYDILWKQAEMDPALEPSIRDIVMSEIYVLRYQGELSKVTQRIATNPTPNDIQRAATYQKLIKETQEQSLKSLTALNLTREKKQALKKSPETTPSRIITNYQLTLDNMTPLEIEKHKQDEADAIRRLHANLRDLFTLMPTQLGVDEDPNATVDA